MLYEDPYELVYVSVSMCLLVHLYCETLQAKLFARQHALCVLSAAGRTWSLFCFIFFCPARGNPVATARDTKG